MPAQEMNSTLFQTIQADITLIQDCLKNLEHIESRLLIEETMRSLQWEQDIVELEEDYHGLKVQKEQLEDMEAQREVEQRMRNLKTAIMEMRKHQQAHKMEARARFREEQEKVERQGVKVDTSSTKMTKSEWIPSALVCGLPVQTIDRRRYRVDHTREREVSLSTLLREGIYIYTHDKVNYLNLHNGYVLRRSEYGSYQTKAVTWEEVIRKARYVRNASGHVIGVRRGNRFYTQPLVKKTRKKKACLHTAQ